MEHFGKGSFLVFPMCKPLSLHFELNPVTKMKDMVSKEIALTNYFNPKIWENMEK